MIGLAVLAYAGFRLYLYRNAEEPVVQRAGMAEAMVVTEPTDATVTIDGRTAGKGSPVTIRNIAPDEEHTISVSKRGYHTDSRRVVLEEGEFSSIAVKLKRSAAPTADMEIVSTPPGAVVFLDDKETPHRTPATLPTIEAGKKHTVGLFLSGYKFWTRKVRFKEGQSKSFDVTLTKSYGSVLVDSEPKGALVIIDGAPTGTTPLTKEELDPDRVYVIQIWHEGYRTERRELKPKPGAHQNVRATLKQLPRGETNMPPLADPGGQKSK